MLSDDDCEADSSHKGEEEKKEASPPAGGGKKRKASLVGAAFLFFPSLVRGGEASSSSSSSSSEAEGASGLSGDESDTTRRRELFRVPVAFFLAFFSGTTWGAGTSSPVKRASAGSSGKGAGQLVCSAFFSQSCQRRGSLDPA